MDEFVVRDLADQIKALVGGIHELNDTLGEKYTTLTNEDEQPDGYLGATTGIDLTPFQVDNTLPPSRNPVERGSYFSDTESAPPTFAQELKILLNKHGMEQYSDTPDWVLTEYLLTSLRAFDLGIKMREGDQTVRMMRQRTDG